MPEHQNIEYKSAWHNDYLKWICGFANAQGGTIFIGKDDNGNVLGIEDYKRLMDDIPNKIRNAMRITVEVNLHEENEMHYIEIVTFPYSVPISLRGRYYYRIGSTKQELTGTALNEFLLKKSGKTWDDVVEPRATLDDIDETAVAKFLIMAKEKGGLLVTMFKNNLTKEQLIKLGLNERQLKAVEYVKDKGEITNKEYQELNGVSKVTAYRDLTELIEQYKLFERKGDVGAGTSYFLIGS